MSKQEEEEQVKADVQHVTRHMVNQFKVAFRDLARNGSFQRLGLAGSLNDDQITDGVHAFLLAVKKQPVQHPK